MICSPWNWLESFQFFHFGEPESHIRTPTSFRTNFPEVETLRPASWCFFIHFSTITPVAPHPKPSRIQVHTIKSGTPPWKPYRYRQVLPHVIQYGISNFYSTVYPSLGQALCQRQSTRGILHSLYLPPICPTTHYNIGQSRFHNSCSSLDNLLPVQSLPSKCFTAASTESLEHTL